MRGSFIARGGNRGRSRGRGNFRGSRGRGPRGDSNFSAADPKRGGNRGSRAGRNFRGRGRSFSNHGGRDGDNSASRRTFGSFRGGPKQLKRGGYNGRGQHQEGMHSKEVGGWRGQKVHSSSRGNYGDSSKQRAFRSKRNSSRATFGHFNDRNGGGDDESESDGGDVYSGGYGGSDDHGIKTQFSKFVAGRKRNKALKGRQDKSSEVPDDSDDGVDDEVSDVSDGSGDDMSVYCDDYSPEELSLSDDSIDANEPTEKRRALSKNDSPCENRRKTKVKERKENDKIVQTPIIHEKSGKNKTSGKRKSIEKKTKAKHDDITESPLNRIESTRIYVRYFPIDISEVELLELAPEAEAFSYCGPSSASIVGIVFTFPRRETADRFMIRVKEMGCYGGRPIFAKFFTDQSCLNDTLYVGGLPKGVDESKLSALFPECVFAYTGRRRRGHTRSTFGLVHFADSEAAKKYVDMKTISLDGCKLKFQMALQRYEEAKEGELDLKALIVDNLPKQAGTGDLKSLFPTAKRVHIPFGGRGRVLARGRKAIVYFRNEEAAAAALKSNVMAKLAGRQIRVTFHMPRLWLSASSPDDCQDAAKSTAESNNDRKRKRKCIDDTKINKRDTDATTKKEESPVRKRKTLRTEQ